MKLELDKKHQNVATNEEKLWLKTNFSTNRYLIYIIKNPILGTQFITNNDRQPSNEANVDENQWKIKVFLLDFYFCFYSLTHSQDDSVYEMNARLALFRRRRERVRQLKLKSFYVRKKIPSFSRFSTKIPKKEFKSPTSRETDTQFYNFSLQFFIYLKNSKNWKKLSGRAGMQAASSGLNFGNFPHNCIFLFINRRFFAIQKQQ